MGLNTRHDKSDTKVSCYNSTRNSYFKYKLLGAKECRKLEISQGFSLNQIKYVLEVNEAVKINLGDRVQLFGGKYKVTSITQSFDNEYQFKHRGDIVNFTGKKVIGLE